MDAGEADKPIGDMPPKLFGDWAFSLDARVATSGEKVTREFLLLGAFSLPRDSRESCEATTVFVAELVLSRDSRARLLP